MSKSIKCFFVKDTGKQTQPEEIKNDEGEVTGHRQMPILRRTDTDEEFEG